MTKRVPLRWPDWIVMLATVATALTALADAWPSWITLSQPNGSGDYVDTTYRIGGVHFRYYDLGTLLIGLFLYVGILRRTAFWVAVTAAFAIVLIMLGFTLATTPELLPFVDFPRRYIDYAAGFERLAEVAEYGERLSLIGSLSLVGLSLRWLVQAQR